MEVLCFAAGTICGMLLIFLSEKSGKASKPASENEKMPKELRLQYENLFGYDGTENEN